MLSKKITILLLLSCFVIAGTFLIWKWIPDVTVLAEAETESNEPEVVKYGLNLTGFTLLNHVVKKNELFTDILSKYNVAANTIDFLATQSKSVFNLNRIKAGNNCTLVCVPGDSGLVASKLIYEENKLDYVVFNFEDSLYIYRGKHDVERIQREVSGIIESSLYATLERNGLNPALAVRMAEIFAWSIDFYKIQKGDRFKIVYDEDLVNGESVGIGEIKAVLFNSSGKDYYAFYHASDNSHEGDYYDEQGNTMKRMFLKAPVKFSRISSGFTKKRFHPVTKVWKAHLGTDYAAPYGTPILATADGIVEEARYKSNNGNYVKIKHNGQYKTQYLHMSKIAKGVKAGTRVKQGEVIGYVGSTGLATGPHVCYRFWKDGKQVDPRKEKLTFAEPLPEKIRQQYLKNIQPVRAALDQIDYQQHNIAVQKMQRDVEAKATEWTTELLLQVF